MQNSTPEYVVGMDIGGTSVVAGVIASRDGRVVSRHKIPTESKNGIDDGLRRLAELVRTVITQAGLKPTDIGGIGVGSTGPVDSPAGKIHNPFTLPGWDGIPVLDHLNAEFKVPSLLVGDCDVAALGEFWTGAGQGVQHMVYVTVGTGIGGAIIFEGKLHRGVALTMSEPGHHSIDLDGPQCYCGARGCWEMFAAAPAITRRTQEAVAAKPDSLILKLAGGDMDKITPEIVSRADEQGDALAAEINRQTGFYLGVGVANLMNILTPEMIILGGGVMQGWDHYYPSMMATIDERKSMVPVDKMKIVPAQLGLSAGITGAARAILERLAGKL